MKRFCGMTCCSGRPYGTAAYRSMPWLMRHVNGTATPGRAAPWVLVAASEGTASFTSDPVASRPGPQGA